MGRKLSALVIAALAASITYAGTVKITDVEFLDPVYQELDPANQGGVFSSLSGPLEHETDAYAFTTSNGNIVQIAHDYIVTAPNLLGVSLHARQDYSAYEAHNGVRLRLVFVPDLNNPSELPPAGVMDLRGSTHYKRRCELTFTAGHALFNQNDLYAHINLIPHNYEYFDFDYDQTGPFPGASVYHGGPLSSVDGLTQAEYDDTSSQHWTLRYADVKIGSGQFQWDPAEQAYTMWTSYAYPAEYQATFEAAENTLSLASKVEGLIKYRFLPQSVRLRGTSFELDIVERSSAPGM